MFHLLPSLTLSLSSLFPLHTLLLRRLLFRSSSSCLLISCFSLHKLCRFTPALGFHMPPFLFRRLLVGCGFLSSKSSTRFDILTFLSKLIGNCHTLLVHL